ncbi:MAG TPA: response regulator [Ruminiclostridium sp.]|nr:response regulator [Ruminiclostridium sp.]
MWKVLIADDEPKIRKGLKNSLDWSEVDAEVVGEAEDGEIALEMAKSLKPDIVLLDICMPFINGLQMVEQLKKEDTDCIIIVITGHDEFSYARSALRLGIFDYILKPVSKEQLKSIVLRAISELGNRRAKKQYFDWTLNQLNTNRNILKENFINDWLENKLTYAQALEQQEYFNISLSENSGMILIKPVEKHNVDETKEWDRELLLFTIENIVQELAENLQPVITCKDNRNNIVAITAVDQIHEWLHLKKSIEQCIEKNLDQNIKVYQRFLENGTEDIPNVYKSMIEEMQRDSGYSPLVLKAKQYIENNYYKEELSLEEVSEQIKVSSAYLSRLLKQETGFSFIDYLTQVRVKMAIQFMKDPVMKIYEIAEKTGYRSQHYFSTAFKKVMGTSPIEYKKGVDW